MNPPVIDPLEEILRQCGTTAPKPWYPKLYAQEAGVPRDSLDLPLERLRLGGLIQLTDWVEGLGQGYILTPGGRRALQNPRELDRLNGKQVAAPGDARLRSPQPREGDATTFEQGETIRGALFASSTPFVTYALVAANILWYVYAMRLAEEQGMAPRTFISSTPQNILLKTGGLQGSYLVSGDNWQWGRLLWCCFVHGNLLHLFVNMVGLLWVGPMVERMWGHIRFLTIYLIAGLGGSCAMVIMNPNTLGVGASGAIWGMMTSLAAWIILNRKSLPSDLVSSALRNLLFLFVLNLAFGFAPGISMSAHLGGGALGAIAAVFLNIHRFGRGVWRSLALAGAIALPLLCLGSVAYAMTIDPRWAILREQEKAHKESAEKDREQREQEERQQAKFREAKKLEQVVKTEYESAHKTSVTAFNLAGQLLGIEAGQRDEKQVAEATTALAQARSELLKAADTVKHAPLASPDSGEGNKILEEYLRKRASLCDLTARYLIDKRNFAGDEERDWNLLSEECLKLRRRWEQSP